MENKINILVVEDEKLAGKALSDTLRENGFRVFLFETGEEALLFLSDHPADIVLLDCKLPGMDGEAVFDRIREIKVFSHHGIRMVMDFVTELMQCLHIYI